MMHDIGVCGLARSRWVSHGSRTGGDRRGVKPLRLMRTVQACPLSATPSLTHTAKRISSKQQQQQPQQQQSHPTQPPQSAPTASAALAAPLSAPTAAATFTPATNLSADSSGELSSACCGSKESANSSSAVTAAAAAVVAAASESTLRGLTFCGAVATPTSNR